MDELREKYIRACQCKPSLEINFVRSHINTVVGFIPTARFESQIAVLNDDFIILFRYDVNAYIGACAISDDGEYIAWQTAYARTEDGASVFLYDVINSQLLFRTAESLPIKYLNGMYIERKNEDILLYCHYKDKTVIYDQKGQIVF